LDTVTGSSGILRTWRTADDVVVVDGCRTVVFEAVVELGDAHEISGFLASETGHIVLRLGAFFTLRILEKKVLKGILCSDQR
jgi:hypothetical protein